MTLQTQSHTPPDSLITGHITCHSNGPVQHFEGDDYVYTEWFPQGVANGRKAYMGFPGTGYWASVFTLNNEATNGDLRFQTNGTGKCVFDCKLDAVTISGNASVAKFEGVDHCYMGFWPKGLGGGRRAWMGFGSHIDNSYSFFNENTSAGHIVFAPGGSDGKVHVTKDLQVDGALIQPNVLSVGDVYTQSKDAVTSLLMRKDTQYYVGTGFFINATGTIVTAGHNLLNTDVLDRVDDIWCTVTNLNGKVGVNRVIKCIHKGVDGAADVGVLTAPGLTSQAYLQWGNASTLKAGDPCYVIGDPMGVDVASISTGVIRDQHYVDVNGQAIMDNMFVDCIAYGGNSGSPILDKNGKVIGIYTFGFTDTEGLGGGPSQSMAEQIVNTILALNGDYTQKGFLGMRWNAVTHQTVVTNGLPLSFDVRGVEIVEIVGGSPMANNGFAVGDIITEVDGQELGNLGENQRSPATMTWFKTSGQQVQIKYIRPPSSTVLTKTVTLANYPVQYDRPLIGNMNMSRDLLLENPTKKSVNKHAPTLLRQKQQRV